MDFQRKNLPQTSKDIPEQWDIGIPVPIGKPHKRHDLFVNVVLTFTLEFKTTASLTSLADKLKHLDETGFGP